MPRKIVATGRGGTGKSTFVALISRYLKPPLFLIDLDPDLSLADMLGVDIHSEGKKTVSEVLYDVIEDRQRGQGPQVSVNERLESLIWSYCLHEDVGFDLIILGTKEHEGCYCFPDHLLKKTIPGLAKNYTHIIIDSPAGLEHLNRKIVSDIDDLFVILDPSEKSMRHIGKVRDITEAVGIHYNNFYLVANYMFDEEAEKYLQLKGENYVGKIAYDPNVEEYNLKGISLLDLPEDSPACLSVLNLLTGAKLV
ncbi:MAG: AAA family ATPase [Syntrophales bacterium]